MACGVEGGERSGARAGGFTLVEELLEDELRDQCLWVTGFYTHLGQAVKIVKCSVELKR